ncbi:unnamed protein product [Zymoseptoria tritici ST99CH_1A5]|uniref:Uncharacterized protein n=1 Tax=Zymoseptoria tritici ST99CH_1A5 TaxID=1276529 RepID=A0A1Y6LF71_ZYMTR|nr:unnamed protein product [Zymoseptoria tritici ST99CH_1A5]
MSGSSPWNVEPLSFAPNTNAMDEKSMPSDKAAAARVKSALVMDAVKRGDMKEADRLMGEQKETGTKGLVPMQWARDIFKGKKGKDQPEILQGKDMDGEESVYSVDAEKGKVGANRDATAIIKHADFPSLHLPALHSTAHTQTNTTPPPDHNGLTNNPPIFISRELSITHLHPREPSWSHISQVKRAIAFYDANEPQKMRDLRPRHLKRPETRPTPDAYTQNIHR